MHEVGRPAFEHTQSQRHLADPNQFRLFPHRANGESTGLLSGDHTTILMGVRVSVGRGGSPVGLGIERVGACRVSLVLYRPGISGVAHSKKGFHFRSLRPPRSV